MPLPDAPHCLKVAIGWTYGAYAQKCLNTFYIEDTSDAIFDDLGSAADAIETAFVDECIPLLYPSVSFDLVELTDVRTVPFGSISFPVGPHAGTKSGTTGAIPASVSISIKKSTGALGRSGRGRWFWPLMDLSTLVTGDTVNTDYANGVKAALASFQTTLEAALSGPKVGIVSYRHGGSQRATAVFEQITSWSYTDLIVDNQRRRLPGRGA